MCQDNSPGPVPIVGNILLSSHFSSGFNIYSSTQRYDGSWHHLVLSHDTTQSIGSAVHTLYIDGIKVGMVNAAGYNTVFGGAAYGNYQMFVGGRSGPTSPFLGLLANVQLYSLVLSPTDVGVLYSLGISSLPVSIESLLSTPMIPSSTLVACWSLLVLILIPVQMEIIYYCKAPYLLLILFGIIILLGAH